MSVCDEDTKKPLPLHHFLWFLISISVMIDRVVVDSNILSELVVVSTSVVVSKILSELSSGAVVVLTASETIFGVEESPNTIYSDVVLSVELSWVDLLVVDSVVD